MDKFKRILSSQKQLPVKLQGPHAKPKPLTSAETEKFANAVVRDYGETLVMLGKE